MKKIIKTFVLSMFLFFATLQSAKADYWIISYCGSLSLDTYIATYVESSVEGVFFNDYCQE